MVSLCSARQLAGFKRKTSRPIPVLLLARVALCTPETREPGVPIEVVSEDVRRPARASAKEQVGAMRTITNLTAQA